MCLCLKGEDRYKLAITLFIDNKPIPIPLGLVLTNNIKDEKRYKVSFPSCENDSLTMTLEEGFRLCYLGQTIVSGLPKMRSIEEIVEHDVLKST